MTASTSDLRLIGGSPLVHARVTGLVGLLVLVSGSFAGFAGSELLVRGDVAATSSRIIESPTLFRFGILGSLAMMTAWLFYALCLYGLLRIVHRRWAMTMLVLVTVSAPIYMLNQGNLFAVLPLASSGELEQAGLFLDLFRFGNSVAAIFFALWLLPLGLLVLRSGFLPRFLGILLLAGTPGYLVLFVQAFFFPGSERTLWTNPFIVVTHASELALLLWLLVRGLNVEQWKRRTLEPGSASP